MLHSKGLFTSHPITQYFILVFQQKKNFKAESKKINSMKTQSKHQNQIQMWYRFWNNHTGI